MQAMKPKYSPFSPSSRQDRLLVVDDLPDNSFLIQAILEEEGYHIEVANDGRSALAHIDRAPFDLILLDVMMPGIDGYEVTRRVRQNTNIPFIPILLITAYDQPSVVKGLDVGADDFVRKPIEAEELLARVRSLLRLKHGLDERDRIARQREDFVSRLTHDLRTPLVAADRMLNLFLDGAFGEIPSDMQEAISILTRSNQALLEMVNTLLRVYRYEAGRQTLNFQTVELKELVQDVIQELSPLAAEKGLSLRTDLADDTLPVEGDRLELRRVLTNLVGNAVKFTDTGWIDVRLSTLYNTLAEDLPKGAKPPTTWVMIEVQDTGAGIPPEEQAMLFERFQQGGHRRTGSGLGLHLSRQIVEAHQGTIQVKSEPGRGSCFTVGLPLR